MIMSEQPGIARLVTFLGRGRFDKDEGRYLYDPTDYEFYGNKTARTPFVCRALAELFRPSDICVLATQEAESDHRIALEEALRTGNYPTPRFVPIKASELWQQFDVITTELRGSTGPVMLDITNGFRSLPFFAAAVVTFVHAVDETPPDLRVCYAAYEAKDSNERVAPIWELTEFVTLLDWSRALAMFLKTGRAVDAGKVTEHLGRDLRKAWFQDGKLGAEPNLKEFGEALIRFGVDLETLRTGDLLIGRGVESSADKLLKAAKDARAIARQHAPPLADILNQVIAIAEPLADRRTDLSGTSGRAAVAALADVYLRFRRFSEAVATVREGWINFYAAETALCPGDERFNEDERFRAECLARAIDKNFRGIGNRRNDVLHAQYKPRKDVQDGPGMERAVREIVAKFKTSQPLESTVGHSEEKLSVKCFVNLTNHPNANWDEVQMKAALALAERIEDIAFPAVPPDADEKEIKALAETCMAQIPPEASHALVQGEFTLTVELVRRLQARGISCLAATSTRNVEEVDGRRVSTFTFVRFRAYAEPGPCEKPLI